MSQAGRTLSTANLATFAKNCEVPYRLCNLEQLVVTSLPVYNIDANDTSKVLYTFCGSLTKLQLLLTNISITQVLITKINIYGLIY